MTAPSIEPDIFANLVPRTILDRSGSVFYSGRAAFSRPCPLYVLGLNPGGSPTRQSDETVAADLADWQRRSARWSAYTDQSWEGKPPGQHGMQPRVVYMMRGLGLDPRDVPASNAMFVRSIGEDDITAEKARLLQLCWPVHDAIIRALGVRVVLCFGTTAGSWVRKQLGAHEEIDHLVELNARRWRSTAHHSAAGMIVVTATHPSRADWSNPATDPTRLVAAALLGRPDGKELPMQKALITDVNHLAVADTINMVSPVAPPVGNAAAAAHNYLLEACARMNLRPEAQRSAITAVKLYDNQRRYLFSWIVNPHHLLFYVRMPALKLAPHLIASAKRALPAAKQNRAGEITLRIETLQDAEKLTGWLFSRDTWTGALSEVSDPRAASRRLK